MNQALATTRNEDPRSALAEWKALQEQARVLVESRFLPSGVNSPEKCVAIMMTGRELGIPPMMALRSIHIIEGKPTLSAQLMQSLVYQKLPAATLNVVETSDQRCTVEAARPGQKTIRFVWTLDRAKKAGLTNKKIWQAYPGDMLRNRCISEACRAVFPDAISGCYTSEELGGEGDYVAASQLDPPRPITVTQAESAPEPATDAEWLTVAVSALEAAQDAAELKAAIDAAVTATREHGMSDSEKAALTAAKVAAQKRVAAAPKPEPEPSDDAGDEHEAREAEADEVREGFE